MAKIVVLELGFEDDMDAEEFADALNKSETGDKLLNGCDVIECRVENP
jgi:hypothetical protein